jgi:hypothetical protein
MAITTAVATLRRARRGRNALGSLGDRGIVSGMRDRFNGIAARVTPAL